MTDDVSGAPSRLDFRGHVIELVGHVPGEGERQPFFLRMLGASAPLGIQEEQWEWSVSGDSGLLAAGHELSREAAIEAAKDWILRSHHLAGGS